MFPGSDIPTFEVLKIYGFDGKIVIILFYEVTLEFRAAAASLYFRSSSAAIQLRTLPSLSPLRKAVIGVASSLIVPIQLSVRIDPP
jgi:hypothetical protein